MAITLESIEVKPGVFQKTYTVVAEGINKYTGKRIQKKRRGIVSRPKAEMVYKELWSQCREERPDGPQPTTWGALKKEYFDYVDRNIRSVTNVHGFSPRAAVTKKSRFVHLGHWDDLHLDFFSAHFVQSELDALESKGIASRVLTRDIQIETKCLFSYAVSRGMYAVNPLASLKKRKTPKKKKKALNHDEVNALLREAKLRNHPYFLIWLLTVTMGFRRSELAGLKWTDIDFESRLAYLCRQDHPKEGIVEVLKDKEDRPVAIPLYVIPVLKSYRANSTSEFVIDVECQKWAGGHQASVTRAFCREIGIKEVTFHELRATHITLALMDGVPTGVVKDNVGHSKLSTTDGYFRSSGIQLKGQTDGLKIIVPNGNESETSAAA
ncbi:MAG: site-specific integrase [Bdellovibrionales bacterium]|nr:site-specific integrase [Bdellovibrionales bacterium]